LSAKYAVIARILGVYSNYYTVRRTNLLRNEVGL